MNLDDLEHSLSADQPPADLSPELLALWHEARGDWTVAHDIVQDVSTAAAARVHAYLHRKEGDLGNARYWYQRAGQPEFTRTLDAEWDAIAGDLLEQADTT